MIDATERRDGSSQIARFALRVSAARAHNGLPGGNSGREPPDPIPNSEVKTSSADGSVGLSHARVGHRQALKNKTPGRKTGGFSFGGFESRRYGDRFLRGLDVGSRHNCAVPLTYQSRKSSGARYVARHDDQ